MKRPQKTRIPKTWIKTPRDEDWLFIVCRALHFLGRPANLGDLAKLVAKHPRASGWGKEWVEAKVMRAVLAHPGIFSWHKECAFKDWHVRQHFNEFDRARRWQPRTKDQTSAE